MRNLTEQLFTAHPEQVGETYLEHLVFASRTGATLLLAGLAAMVHGVLPCLFERTSSSTVLRLAGEMRVRNDAGRSGHTAHPATAVAVPLAASSVHDA